MIKNIFLFLFCFLATARGYSQIDTAFWFSAPDISSASGQGDFPIFLRCITHDEAAVVTISQPANGGFTPIVISIPANSRDSVNLTFYLASLENTVADVVNNKGLKISSTKPISVIYELKAANNKEFIALKGANALGTEFYTPFQKNWANGQTSPQSFSSIEIVATEDLTTLLITPRTNVIGSHLANTSYTVAINKGQTFSVRDTNRTAATSLAGSIVSSNKPVAVTLFSGALNNSGTLSCMMDQITSTSHIGTDFVIRKGKGIEERVYVLATQNATNIEVHGVVATSSFINASETNEILLTDSVTFIKTSKPVYVWHVNGFNKKMSGAQVPHVYCSGGYSASTTRTSSDSLALILFVRTGFEGNFTLNGNAALIPASVFADVPGTAGALKCAQIFYSTSVLPIHSMVKVANSGDVFGMGVLQGNSTNGNAYTYFSNFASTPSVNAGADVTKCSNAPVILNGIVGGGNVTGVWSTNGFGSFQSSTASLNNAYLPSANDSTINPVKLILTSTGPCTVIRDTLFLTVTPAPIVNASSDKQICGNAGQVSLSGVVNGSTTTGYWSTNGTGSFLADSTSLNATYQLTSADTALGALTFVLSASNLGTCLVVRDTMLLEIGNIPIVNAGLDTINVCENNPAVSILGSVSGPTNTGKWTTSGLGVFDPNNVQLNTTFNPHPNDISAGQIMIYLSSTNNGTCLPVKDSIRVIFTSAPLVNAGDNGISCKNDAGVFLSGSVSGATTTGYWTGGSGTFVPDSSALNAMYIPSAPEVLNGMFVLTLISTNNGGCNSNSDNITYNFVDQPTASFSTSNVCLGIESAFQSTSVQGAGTINQWTYDFGDGNSTNTANSNHTYSSPGDYNVKLIVYSSVGCSDTSINIVTIYPNPSLSFNDSIYCTGVMANLSLADNSTIPSPESITSWSWTLGGTQFSTIKNTTANFTIPGTYTIGLTVKSNHNCVSSSTRNVVVPGFPNASFLYEVTPGLNIGAVVNFADSSQNATINSWNFGDNGASSTELNPSYTYYANGNYNVVYVVSNQIGCTDTAKINLVIKNVSDDIVKLIPNAISPNNDGKNDTWKLSFVDLMYPKTTVEIYNRWGQKVFYSEGYKTPWDGLFNGEELPLGNYYYIINLNDPSKPDVYKGAILLVR